MTLHHGIRSLNTEVVCSLSLFTLFSNGRKNLVLAHFSFILLIIAIIHIPYIYHKFWKSKPRASFFSTSTRFIAKLQRYTFHTHHFVKFISMGCIDWSIPTLLTCDGLMSEMELSIDHTKLFFPHLTSHISPFYWFCYTNYSKAAS